ncbi:hypothetical protein PMAYCL1PPCAC_04568, partial [Pristionchus mayeri]
QTALVMTVAQMQYQMDPIYVNHLRADLTRSLATLASRWVQTEKEYDELVQVYDQEDSGEKPEIQTWEGTLD